MSGPTDGRKRDPGGDHRTQGVHHTGSDRCMSGPRDEGHPCSRQQAPAAWSAAWRSRAQAPAGSPCTHRGSARLFRVGGHSVLSKCRFTAFGRPDAANRRHCWRWPRTCPQPVLMSPPLLAPHSPASPRCTAPCVHPSGAHPSRPPDAGECPPGLGCALG